MPKAPLPSKVLSLPAGPESVVSPALAALLSSTSESRAVVDVGGALLPSTSRSRAVIGVGGRR